MIIRKVVRRINDNLNDFSFVDKSESHRINRLKLSVFLREQCFL